MTKRESACGGGGQGKALRRAALSGPHAIGIASLVAAGCCACWLRAGHWLPIVSPLRALGLVVVGAYLVSATLLLLEER